jgi:hypothetical protein
MVEMKIPVHVYIVPESIKTQPNTFSHTELSVGRKINDMEIVEFGESKYGSHRGGFYKSTLFRNFDVKFKGRKTLTGRFEPINVEGVYGGIQYIPGITEEKVKNSEIVLKDLNEYSIKVNPSLETSLPMYELDMVDYLKRNFLFNVCFDSGQMKDIIQMADEAGVKINDMVTVIFTDYKYTDATIGKAVPCKGYIKIESITKIENN